MGPTSPPVDYYSSRLGAVASRSKVRDQQSLVGENAREGTTSVKLLLSSTVAGNPRPFPSSSLPHSNSCVDGRSRSWTSEGAL